jgi:LysM repeat protein
MDNISRDNNTSYLPVAGIIAGALAIVIAIAGFVKANGVKNDLGAKLDDLSTRVDTNETSTRKAQADAGKANDNVNALAGQMQTAFTQVSTELGKINGDIKVLQDTHAKVAVNPKGPKGDNTPVTAGKDEYVVKGGDTGSKIASATGFSVKALEAVNPGVDWTKLRIGTKLKLPAK